MSLVINFNYLFAFLFFLDIDNLIADEFSAELVEGVAFVAGHDEESRPVLVKPHFLSKFLLINARK